MGKSILINTADCYQSITDFFVGIISPPKFQEIVLGRVTFQYKIGLSPAIQNSTKLRHR